MDQAVNGRGHLNMEKKIGLESLKRNTDFLRINHIDFYILDYSIENRLAKEEYSSVWRAVKEMLPYNSFFLEMGLSRAAVILPEKSAEEAERLLNATIETAGNGEGFTAVFEGKVCRDITEDLELDGITYKKVVDPEVMSLHEETETAYSEKNLKLSILDDDEVIRMFLGDQLDAVDWGEWEVDLQVYREGESFLNSGRLQENGKHIIILDGIMPRMDGMEVLSEIRKKYNESEVSIIMLTSRNRENDIVSALEAGAFDYVTKPFKINELIARIKRVAKRMENGDG
ncbi:response regulator [Rossellomorea vietnamensis]|uniref:Response regulator n=2 Tax=Rossellomorea vietnamensis TaxID=218284 RepID=A0A5D4NM25_9BACI|nr:response regulator [Rossellomorea vietnamensis]